MLAVVAALASCAVDKADLARRVDLRDVDVQAVPDGVYEASYTIRPPFPVMAANSTVQVRVTVAGGKYARIEIVQPPKMGDTEWGKKLMSRLVDTQRLSMDAVTSATITSTAILKAVQRAVEPGGGTP